MSIRPIEPRVWRPLIACGWPVVFVTWLHVRFSPLGFHPTDDGYILAQAWRILGGEVPHRDVVSPRPLGSAVLHLVDLLIPIPLFEASRLIFLVQVTTYSLLLAWLVYRQPPRTWNVFHVLGAGASILVNLHTFPMTAWHTTDGLTFVAGGLVLVDAAYRRDNSYMRWFGLALLGTSVLMKQSFLAAPLLGLARSLWERRGSSVGRLTRTVSVDGAFTVLPGLVYVGVVILAGGLGEMVSQVAGAAGKEWPIPVIDPARADDGASLLLLLVAELGLVLMMSAARWGGRARRGPLEHVVAIVPRVLLTLLIVRVTLDDRLGFTGPWANRLLLMLIALLVARALLERAFDAAGLAVVVMGVMISLSFGYALPNLVAGTMALVMIHRVWAGTELSATRQQRLVGTALTAGAAVLTVFVGGIFVGSREKIIYRDQPEPGLTSPLRSVTAEFGRVRTNPTTARYLAELRDCIERHPARAVAVLPDNPGLYPALHLSNPFPVDWLLPLETGGAEQQILAAARALASRGDYLVLFQTFPAGGTDGYQPASAQSKPFFYDPVLGERLMNELNGQRVTCGGFVGVYAPVNSR